MRKIRIKPYVRIRLNENEKKVYIKKPFKNSEFYDVYEVTEVGISLINLLNTEIEESELKSILLEKFPNSEDEISSILNLLLEELYIEYDDTENIKLMDKQYERILPIWSEFETINKSRFQIFKELGEKKIGIIGCGTIGTSVAVKLAMSGISHFILMDDDIIEVSNMSRQALFDYGDIGKNKVDACKEKIINRHPNPTVETHFKKLTDINELDVFKSCDLIILCGDYPSFEHLSIMLEHFSYKNKVPVSFGGGYSANDAKIYPIVVPGETKCFSCLRKELAKGVGELGKKIGNTNNISGTVQLSDIISSIVSFEILKFLMDTQQNYMKNHFKVFSMAKYETITYSYETTDGCSMCSYQKEFSHAEK